MRYPGRTGTGTLSVLGGNISSLKFCMGGGSLDPRCVRALLGSVYTRYVRLGFSAYRKRAIRLTRLLITCFRGGKCSLAGLRNSIGCSPVNGVVMGNGSLDGFVAATGRLMRMLTPLPGFHYVYIGTVRLGGTKSCVSRRLNCTLT